MDHEQLTPLAPAGEGGGGGLVAGEYHRSVGDLFHLTPDLAEVHPPEGTFQPIARPMSSFRTSASGAGTNPPVLGRSFECDVRGGTEDEGNTRAGL